MLSVTRESLDLHARSRIRAWLQFYKDQRGWTNDRLAAVLGVTEPAVTMILNGSRNAGLDLLIRMHHKLGRSMDDFIDSDPPKRPQN